MITHPWKLKSLDSISYFIYIFVYLIASTTSTSFVWFIIPLSFWIQYRQCVGLILSRTRHNWSKEITPDATLVVLAKDGSPIFWEKLLIRVGESYKQQLEAATHSFSIYYRLPLEVGLTHRIHPSIDVQRLPHPFIHHPKSSHEHVFGYRSTTHQSQYYSNFYIELESRLTQLHP